MELRDVLFFASSLETQGQKNLDPLTREFRVYGVSEEKMGFPLLSQQCFLPSDKCAKNTAIAAKIMKMREVLAN